MSAARHPHGAMDDVRTGARFRALRHRLGWRQLDLAGKADVSQGVISLIERGRIDDVTIRKLRRIARELDAEFTTQLRWRGGDLDKVVDEAHARLVGVVSAMLRDAGWDVRLEVSYSIYGERGSIDILAWHATARLLLVVEVKSELIAVEETLRKHDEKVRLAPRIVADQFGWRAIGTARLLVLPSMSTPRRRVERHGQVMGAAYPLRGAEVRRWLGNPAGSMSGLLFVDVDAGSSRTAAAMPRKRIRPRGPAAASISVTPESTVSPR
jgi:transcriptional regulator with XRE-family HTH domain